MALHEKLTSYSQEDHIHRFNKVLRCIEKDLARIDCRDWTVEVLRLSKTSFWERFFTLSDVGSNIEQVMLVRGRVNRIDFSVVVPMALGLLQPYTIDIVFNTPINCIAQCRRFIFWSKWYLTPEDPARLQQLRSLGIPSVNLDHSWGGYKTSLQIGHEIIADGASKSRWVVHSGFQGFVFGVGPRVAKYVCVAPKVEALLKAWASGPAL